ncbi:MULTISPECIES: hypothetical protein [unclassified Nocardia]|uniref:hypothetical protein n=1 Tax=unclassified Nocardia TaxID=2637762 RepID=UPI001CE49914|nr:MULTISPECIES: hypothetical protein [unclassified Nocardia]
MPSGTPASDARPKRGLPTTAQVDIKVRIVGSPTAADLDKLTTAIAKRVRRQLDAAHRGLPTGAKAASRAIPAPESVASGVPHSDYADAKRADLAAVARSTRQGDYADAKRADLELLQRQREAGQAAARKAEDRRAAKRREIENLMGTSYPALVLALGLGPSEIDPFELERVLAAAGVLRLGRDISTDDPHVVGRKTVLDEVLEPDPYSAERLYTTGRVGTAAEVAAAQEHGRAEALGIIKRGLYAAGQARPGSASEGLVSPRSGTRYYGKTPTYEVRPGPIKDDIPPYAGLLPPPPLPPGEVNQNRGFQREIAVARLWGGTLAWSRIRKDLRLEDLPVRFTRPNGQSDVVHVDVIGPNGELALVGGAGKAINVADTIKVVAKLKLAAAERGVAGVAFFARDTPQEVLDKAIKHLGPDNVRLYDDPEYQEPPR